MPHYDFNKDYPIARETEEKVAKLLVERYDAKDIEFGYTWKWDISAKINGKTWTFEVKEDFTCEKTGNVGVEFECRGRPSGISRSEADFYVYVIHTPDDGTKVYIFPTINIKNMRDRKDYHKIVNGGDPGSNSLNYLFRLDTFISHGEEIWPGFHNK